MILCDDYRSGVECSAPQLPDWFVLPVGDGIAMQRVNVFQFYRLGHVVHALSTTKEGSKVKEVYYRLSSAQMWLEYLLQDQLVPLGVARPACLTLLEAVKNILKPPAPNSFVEPEESAPSLDMERTIDPMEAFNITNDVQTFETVLGAQLQSLSTYFVSRKLAYETPLLIEEAETLLPEDIRKEVPEAIQDLQQAGKCIAFEIPTAAGFHIIRATEAVIRKYYTASVGKPPKMKMRNWGTYIKNLATAKADARVTGFVDHIRETYRNPVLHPEETLTPQDAQVLLGVCVSAIVLMVSAMKTIQAQVPRFTALSSLAASSSSI